MMGDLNRDPQFMTQLDALINGTMTEAEHQSLQQRLKTDAAARALFCERMDLEASLRTWATEQASQPLVSAPARRREKTAIWKHITRWPIGLSAAAACLVLLSLWWSQRSPSPPEPLASQPPTKSAVELSRSTQAVGQVIESSDCRWTTQPLVSSQRFTTGTVRLASGAAEFRFDSGTNVILEGPCEMQIESADTTRLLAGNVFVDVTDVSNGFTLLTPEARILDEGTQYAVSLDADSTEVHVFEGSVIWIAERGDREFEDRIGSGEAKRFTRAAPNRPHGIPFGQRQFVRRIESDIRNAAGAGLLAYDGFENLAGQLRRGRSGFGWSGGWESAGRGRGPLAAVIDAPDDVVFDFERRGRRLLVLKAGDELRRSLAQPLEIKSGESCFVSVLVSRQAAEAGSEMSLQISLEPAAETDSRRVRRPHTCSFGLTADGFPFVNSGDRIATTATPITNGETYLCVLQYHINDLQSTASLRVYHPGEVVEQNGPTTWTVTGSSSSHSPRFVSLRLAAGQTAHWHLDELRIASTWYAVVSNEHDNH